MLDKSRLVLLPIDAPAILVLGIKSISLSRRRVRAYSYLLVIVLIPVLTKSRLVKIKTAIQSRISNKSYYL